MTSLLARSTRAFKTLLFQIIKVIASWYSKIRNSVGWQLIIKIRKLFIIINALIGVYAVIHISGFSFDNIIGGISGLGSTYVELITNFFS